MKETITLSRRLSALAALVTPGSRVCDLGCDHGFLSIYLIRNGISPHVTAMDVRKGPLSRAREHTERYGLGDYITLRLSDGLKELTAGEADTLVCAGMGGRLMRRILEEEPEKAGSFRELVLQPQSELMQFRGFLREQGYRTGAENIVFEDGKYYFLMQVNPTGSPIPCGDPLYDRFGRLLLQGKNPVLRRYLEENSAKLKALREKLAQNGDSSRAGLRLQEVEGELAETQRALESFF